MKFEGRIFKNRGMFLVEIPVLGLLSQGRSLKEAKEMSWAMVEDAIEDDDFYAVTTFLGDKKFIVEGSDSRLLIGLMLRNLRQQKGLSIRDVVSNLGLKSPRSYSAYENGERLPSTDKLIELISAIDPDRVPVTSLIKVS